jgi:hypothetical protein
MIVPFIETGNTREVLAWSRVEGGEHDFFDHSQVDLWFLRAIQVEMLH